MVAWHAVYLSLFEWSELILWYLNIMVSIFDWTLPGVEAYLGGRGGAEVFYILFYLSIILLFVC